MSKFLTPLLGGVQKAILDGLELAKNQELSGLNRDIIMKRANS